MVATLHRFFQVRPLNPLWKRLTTQSHLQHFRTLGVDLSDRGFSMRYHTTVPRQVRKALPSLTSSHDIRGILEPHDLLACRWAWPDLLPSLLPYCVACCATTATDLKRRQHP
jgi:hypothetical protein